MQFLTDLFKAQTYDPNNFFLIAGPCVVEDEALVMEIADKVYSICKNLGIPYIFKASYRKANRTSASSFTGIGDQPAMELIRKVGQTYNLPTTSDIHAHEEAAEEREWPWCRLAATLRCSARRRIPKTSRSRPSSLMCCQ